MVFDPNLTYLKGSDKTVCLVVCIYSLSHYPALTKWLCKMFCFFSFSNQFKIKHSWYIYKIQYVINTACEERSDWSTALVLFWGGKRLLNLWRSTERKVRRLYQFLNSKWNSTKALVYCRSLKKKKCCFGFLSSAVFSSV